MAPEQGPEKAKSLEKSNIISTSTNNTAVTTTTTTTTTALIQNLKPADDGHPPQRAASPKLKKIKTTWVAYLNKAELEAYLRELGMDPVGTVEELRRRLSTFINAGYYPIEVTQRLSDLETRHTPGTSIVTTAAPGVIDTLGRSSTYIITSGVGTNAADSIGATYAPAGNTYPCIQDRTYDRIRKWKLEYTGGTDPIDFIERVEELARSQRIPLDEVPATLSECLKDSALAWWRNRRHEWSGWDTFRSGFLKYFLPANFWEDLDDSIRGRKQQEDEPFREYALALETLMRHTQYDTSQKLERIYKNSLPAIKLLIKRREFESLDEFTALVSHVEVTRGTIGPQSPLTKTSNITQSRTINATPQPPISNPRHVCRRCAIPGHFAAQCQNPVQLFCWTCGKRGIRTKDCCPPTTTKLNSVHVSMHAQQALKVSEPINTGRSFECTIDAGPRTYQAIIDTGSWHSYISGSAVRELPSSVYKREPCYLRVLFANGTKGQVKSAVEIQYEFHGEQRKCKLLILEGSQDSFILGMNFLNTVGVTLQLGRSTAALQGNASLRLTKLQLSPDPDLPHPVEPEAPPSDQSTPETSEAEQSMPDLQISEQSMPDLQISEQSMPDLQMSEQSTPDLQMSEQSTPDLQVSEQPTPDPQVAEQSTPAIQLSEQSTPDDPDQDPADTGTKPRDTQRPMNPPPDNLEIPAHISTFLKGALTKFVKIKSVARMRMHRLFMKDDIPTKQSYDPRNPAQQKIFPRSGSESCDGTNFMVPGHEPLQNKVMSFKSEVVRKLRSKIPGKPKVARVSDSKEYCDIHMERT